MYAKRRCILLGWRGCLDQSVSDQNEADKMIPVPFMLYEVMQQYIKKNHIHANDYVFKLNREEHIE